MTIKALAIGFVTLIAVALLFLAYQAGLDAGRQKIQAIWDGERIEQARQRAEALRKTRLREMDLQMTIDRLRGDHHETVVRITAERDTALRELRRRPERPAGYVPAAAQAAGSEPTPSCSGTQLWRDDAEFLVRLAADADAVRAALTECRAAYDSASQPTP
jgi:hypothetical protein